MVMFGGGMRRRKPMLQGEGSPTMMGGREEDPTGPRPPGYPPVPPYPGVYPGDPRISSSLGIKKPISMKPVGNMRMEKPNLLGGSLGQPAQDMQQPVQPDTQNILMQLFSKMFGGQ